MRKFSIKLIKLFLLAMTLSIISKTTIYSQDYHYIGPMNGTTPALTNTLGYMGYYAYNSTHREAIYTPEMVAVNGMVGVPYLITNLSFHKSNSSSYSGSYSDSAENSYVFMKNLSSATAQAGTIFTSTLAGYNNADSIHSAFIKEGWTCVKGPYTLHMGNSTANSWDTDIGDLDEPFFYEGEYLAVMFVYFGGGYYYDYCSNGCTASYFMRYYTAFPVGANACTYGYHYYQFYTCGTAAVECSTYVDKSNAYAQVGADSYIPYLRLGYELPSGDYYYYKSSVKQASTRCFAGMENASVIGTTITILGDRGEAPKVDRMKFGSKGSGNRISSAKLYHLGKSAIESVLDKNNATLIGEITGAGLLADEYEFVFSPISLESAGAHNFVLCYDISRGAAGGAKVDAELIDFHLYTSGGDVTLDPPTTTPDPAGELEVVTGGYTYTGSVNADGNPPTGTISYYGVGTYPYYQHVLSFSSFGPSMVGGLPGMITNLAAFPTYQYTGYGSEGLDSIFIYMRNSSTGISGFPQGPLVFTSSPMSSVESFGSTHPILTAMGYTLVKSPWNWDADPDGLSTNVWIDAELDEPFQYEGKFLDIAFAKFNGERNYNTIRYAYVAGTSGTAYYRYQYNTEGTFNPNNVYSYPIKSNGPTDYNTPNPFLRFNFDYAPGYKFKEGRCFHSDKIFAGCGATNVEILGTNIITVGRDEDPYMFAKSFTFDGKQSYDNQQITHARMFYSSGDSAFSTSRQFGETIVVTENNINNLVFEDPNGMRLGLGNNYFWLSYQIEGDEVKSNYQEIDAMLVDCMLLKVDEFYGETYEMPVGDIIANPDPKGEKTIRAPLRNGIYYVGSPTGQPDNISYETLADCAREFSEIGVTVNTEIRVVTSITSPATAIFDAAPFGDDIVVTLRPDVGKTDLVLTNGANVVGSSVIRLNGAANFHIEGSNMGADGTTYDLTFVKTGRGNTIEMLSGANNIIRNTTINGLNSAITISNTNGFEIVNNRISRSAASLIDITNGSRNGIIDNNIIGYDVSAATTSIANGISILGGSNNITISNNIIRNIRGNATGTPVSSAVTINGASSNRDLAIKIYNNTFANISNRSANAIASVFQIENASNVKVYHNTTMQIEREALGYTTIFYCPTNTVSIESVNNLFVNTVVNQANVYSQYVISPVNNLFTKSDYNLYNGVGTYIVPVGGSSLTGLNFEMWRTSTSYDQYSSRTNFEAFYIDEANFRFNVDGPVIGIQAGLVPVLDANLYPGAEKDIDGIVRGEDDSYPNTTTVGSDEVLLDIFIDPAFAELPERYVNCEDRGESILFSIIKRFSNWKDGIERSYSPEAFNYWVRVNDETGEIIDTLSTENGGYRTDAYPFFYIEKPSYEQSLFMKCISNVGYYSSETVITDLMIIKQPEFYEQPENVISCLNSGVAETHETWIYGTYQSLQWERQIGSTWQEVNGQDDLNLKIEFVPTQAGAQAIEGTYRLRINSFPGYCGLSNFYYSNPMTISVGYPLTSYSPYKASHTMEALEEGVCRGNEIWLAAGIPDGDPATITGYRWEKWDVNVNEFLPVSQAVNVTAGMDTFRIYSPRVEEDAGIYRCVILGIPVCIGGNYIEMPPVNVNIVETAEIVIQTVPVFTCLGNRLSVDSPNELLTASVTEPDGASFINQYAWFKDGRLFVRFNNNGDTISVIDDEDLYDIRRTDTTYLPFEQISFEDEGLYKLRIIYVNCVGEIDTMFTEEVPLNVFDKTEIVSQTSTVYGIRNGFVEMYVNVVTPGATIDAPVEYQWYRKYPTTSVMLTDDGHFYGTRSQKLLILDINSSDINNLALDAVNDYYYCVVKGLCNGEFGDTSDPVILKIAPEINISANPSNRVVCENNNVYFTATFSPSDITESVTYTWYKGTFPNGTPVPGTSKTDIGNVSITATLNIQNVSSSDAGTYYLLVTYTNLAGATINTNAATLTVETAPRIESITGDTLIDPANPLQLTVNVVHQQGVFYNYEWFYNDNPIVGANSQNLWVSPFNNQEGYYKVVVTSENGCGEDERAVRVTFTGISESVDINFRILSVQPNPMSNEATIHYMLPSNQVLSLTLLDMSGKEVCELYAGMGVEGQNSFRISDKLIGLSNGTYFVILSSNNKKTSYKISIVK